jgi:hypothetical protein
MSPVHSLFFRRWHQDTGEIEFASISRKTTSRLLKFISRSDTDLTLRVFKDLGFDDWATDEGVTDAALCASAAEIDAGLVDARLGGLLLKKRVAAPGRGKSRSWRVIVAWKQGERLFFLHGFAKKDKDNITKKEKAALTLLGEQYMRYDDATLAAIVADGDLLEIGCHEQDS